MDTDPGLAYWITRVAIVGVWGFVAIRSWQRSRSSARPRAWRVAMGVAAWLAMLRTTTIDWRLLLYLRGRFRGSPVSEYADTVEHFLLGVILCIAILLLVWLGARLRRGGPGSGAAFTAVAAALMLLFTVWETFSVDELLPDALLRQPGRYVLEMSLAVTAALGTWRRGEERASAADAHGPTLTRHPR